MTTTVCKRVHPRYRLEAEAVATVDFVYPFPGGHHCSMRLRDISSSGISFVLGQELPGLEAGDSIDRVTVRVGKTVLHGDLLIMHLTPDTAAGSACGALFYPRGDRTLVSLQKLIESFEVVTR